MVPIKEFKTSEFRCQCGHANCDYGYEDMDVNTLSRLFTARKLSKVSYILTSAVRCPRHQLAIKNPTSSHNANRELGITCKAVDIAAVTSSEVFEIEDSLKKAGFVRLGWNQQKKFIHADTDPNKPQRVFFPY